MINETLVSFKDLFKSKVRNPFFGTLATVWVIHNWDLVYSLFHFDKNWTREMKVDYLNSYFVDPGFLGNMFICVGITIVVLMVSYVLMNVAFFIKNLSKDVVSPWVQKSTNRSKIRLKVDLDKVEIEKNLWRQKYEEEQKRRLGLQNDYEVLEKRLKQTIQENSIDGDDRKVIDGGLLFSFREFKKSNAFDLFVKILLNNSTNKINELSEDEIIEMKKWNVISSTDQEIDSGQILFNFTETGQAFKVFYEAGL